VVDFLKHMVNHGIRFRYFLTFSQNRPRFSGFYCDFLAAEKSTAILRIFAAFFLPSSYSD